MRCLKAPSTKLASTRITSTTTTPPAEYNCVRYLFSMVHSSTERAASSSGPMAADDHVGGEQRECDHRQEIQHVARIDDAFLQAIEVRENGKSRNRFDDRRTCSRASAEVMQDRAR